MGTAHDLIFYIERGELSASQYEGILRVLWAHGAHLSRGDAYNTTVGTWEEQLQQPAYYGHGNATTLVEAIASYRNQGYAQINFYDRTAELALIIDPDLLVLADMRGESTPAADFPYGHVRVSIPSYHLHPAWSLANVGLDGAATLLTPYQQIHYAVLHWAEVLCDYLHPAFAFSFDENGLARGENGTVTDSNAIFTDADALFMPLVRAGHVPPIRDWIKHLEILYLGSPLLTPDILNAWLRDPGRWTRLLANEGMLSFAQPFSYDQTVANQLVQTGMKSLLAHQVEEAKVVLLRARAIYESIGDSEGVYRCDSLLKQS